MNPASRRLLFGFFMSFPGVLLAVAGSLGAIASVIGLTDEQDVPGALLYLGYLLASAVVSGMGSCMVAFADMQEGMYSHRRGERPRVIFTRIGLMVMALLSGCAALAAMGYLGHERWLPALGAFVTGGLLFLPIVIIRASQAVPPEEKGPGPV